MDQGIRIESISGNPSDIQVFGRDGNEIKGIKKIEIVIDYDAQPKDMSKITLTMRNGDRMFISWIPPEE